MDSKTFARVVAVIFIAAAITAAAVGLTRKGDKSGSAVLDVPGTLRSPLREGLRHCQALGEAALRDGGCLRLWAEQRDLFLGSKAPFASSTSEPAASQSPSATTQGAR